MRFSSGPQREDGASDITRRIFAGLHAKAQLVSRCIGQRLWADDAHHGLTRSAGLVFGWIDSTVVYPRAAHHILSLASLICPPPHPQWLARTVSIAKSWTTSASIKMSFWSWHPVCRRGAPILSVYMGKGRGEVLRRGPFRSRSNKTKRPVGVAHYGGSAASTHWSSHAQDAGVAFSKNQLGAALAPCGGGLTARWL